MSITIGRANATDIPAIVEIIRLAFSETASSTQINACLPNHIVWVARSVGQVVGFIDGFTTTAHDGTSRLELDLLAVHPDYYGQGVGTHLIRHFTRTAQPHVLIRALVATDNHAMQRAIGQVNYTPLPDTYHLYVSSHSIPSVSVPVLAHGHLFHVNTFIYRGIWLEANIDRDTITAALTARQTEGDIVGSVVRDQEITALSALQAYGFTFIKAFHWWRSSKRSLC
ncbi:MAG: GNAT family N-acetyltransferase [Anaerolineae bacterium]